MARRKAHAASDRRQPVGRRHVLLSQVLGPLGALGMVGGLVGCGGGADRANPGPAHAQPQGVVVTKDNPDLPTGCRPLPIGRLAVTFSAALSRGDHPTLERVWRGRFKWFSVGGPRSARSIGPLIRPRRDSPRGATRAIRAFRAENRHDALGYADHPRGFEMHLAELTVNGRPHGGDVDASYMGRWREGVGAKARTYRLVGKGAVNCGRHGDGPSIRVWTMSVNGARGLPPPICPKASDSRGRLVVCWMRQ